MGGGGGRGGKGEKEREREGDRDRESGGQVVKANVLKINHTPYFRQFINK